MTRSFFSWTSTSLAPPTLITAMPPLSFASRSCSFSLHQPGTRAVGKVWPAAASTLPVACRLSARPGCRLSHRHEAQEVSFLVLTSHAVSGVQ